MPCPFLPRQAPTTVLEATPWKQPTLWPAPAPSRRVTGSEELTPSAILSIRPTPTLRQLCAPSQAGHRRAPLFLLRSAAGPSARTRARALSYDASGARLVSRGLRAARHCRWRDTKSRRQGASEIVMRKLPKTRRGGGDCTQHSEHKFDQRQNEWFPGAKTHTAGLNDPNKPAGMCAVLCVRPLPRAGRLTLQEGTLLSRLSDACSAAPACGQQAQDLEPTD